MGRIAAVRKVIRLLIAGGLLVAGFATGFGTAWEWQSLRADSATLERIESEREGKVLQAKRVGAAAVGYEAARGSTRTEFLTITERVDHVVQNPIYRDVCFDDAGLRAIADATAATGNSGVAGGTLPTAARPE